MAAQNTLQGSLFNEPSENLLNSIGSKTKNKDFSEELSDQELTADAKKRPRVNKKEIDPQNPNNDFTSKHPFKSNKELTKWSHHSLVNINNLTPVLKHYVELKSKHPERVLLYRLGDFFECFFEDAIKLSQLLELTLTGKEGGKLIGRVPMAGVPHHAAERYCAELINKGLSISICDQLESTPSHGGALLKRGITRVITPGTIIEEGMLQARKNNWLVAVLIEENRRKTSLKWGLARADVSTGDLFVSEGESANNLHEELAKLDASEIIFGQFGEIQEKQWCPKNLHLTQVAKTPFTLLEAEFSLKKHYKFSTTKGLGLDEIPLALRAAGGLINYLEETQPANDEVKEKTTQILLELPQIISREEILLIDSQTKRNLEITSTQKDGQFQGSLLWAIDRTLTAMGGRCLRRWIEAPLIKVDSILSRQAIVSMFVESSSSRRDIRRLLKTMGDLERLAGRASAGQASARDLIAIADGLKKLPQLASYLQELPENAPNWLKILKETNPNLSKVAELIKTKLINNPPLSLTDGGLINDGVNGLLDGLRNQIDDQDSWLKSQEILERNLSGINNLKLQYHRTFGYFLSVSKSKAKDVPKHWIRRQTLANEERFITPDLKSREGKIFQIKARSAQKEYEIFSDLRKAVGDESQSIREFAKAIAGLDSLISLAEIAAINSYTKPEIIGMNEASKNRRIKIENCRHPVVEEILVDREFTPNNINIGNKFDLIILTGPNASGKSCYLRQIGLVQLLSQIGSWIPAEKASLTIADRIFTRVGAVDDLSAGQSTFVVEMSETAFILNQATKNSLVLLDEIGRGTSTFDGLSIAWAVSEHLAKVIKSRTIFATHYHELNSLCKSVRNIANFQVLVEETGEELIFLHKVVPGGAHRSYGIEAARLAGVPKNVVNRAKVVLKDLQKNNGPKLKSLP
tara:strand:- start:5844 stop:8609 length:2766 start_codon:yes stop_codon:yes gene_type:complete